VHARVLGIRRRISIGMRSLLNITSSCTDSLLTEASPWSPSTRKPCRRTAVALVLRHDALDEPVPRSDPRSVLVLGRVLGEFLLVVRARRAYGGRALVR